MVVIVIVSGAFFWVVEGMFGWVGGGWMAGWIVGWIVG